MPYVRFAGLLVSACPLLSGCAGTGIGPAGQSVERVAPGDWREAEAGALCNHRQLTFADRFVKAGESYFSPDDGRVVFQAIEVPPEGETASGFYAMYVGDVARDREGRITSLENVRRMSPAGSVNTCGWFHPTDPDVVIFGSTLGPPTESTPPGYDGASGRYRWMFPPEMRIVRHVLSTGATEVLLGDTSHYQAECSLSRDARHLLYCSVAGNEGDVYVRDERSGRVSRLVQARGYDGGPFFSPDDARICYRSDRHNDHLLQLFVADLARDEGGTIVGIEQEHQLTDDGAVNWCPFWHPGGRHLVYSSSGPRHNYDIFAIDADPGNLPGSNGTMRYGTNKRRITWAEGADVLPAFSSDGRTMIWTSKRGPAGTSQLWVADFVLDLDARPKMEITRR